MPTPFSLRRVANVRPPNCELVRKVEMIESFYGKKRMRDPKMATEVTKLRERWSYDRRFYARNLPLSREMAINLQSFGGG
jgi:hypothetical protein